MAPDLQVLEVLARHGVPFVVIGGHAVNFHGSLRATEDTDEPVASVWETAVELDGVRFASLAWIRRMKRAAGRPKDLMDLEMLPGDD